MQYSQLMHRLPAISPKLGYLPPEAVYLELVVLTRITGACGIRFSGGQRQRIGLARALYHRLLLLILTEQRARWTWLQTQ